MVKTTFELDDDLDLKFRDAVYKKFGLKKGTISIAINQAIREWIKK